MKILQIRLKNLNSLVGAWEIDLTHPAYESGGIFAIIGPTGAGKTTILDALCLALYGRTPRLSKVTKGVNDIISRQTGECYAEVTFATQSGRFCCNWSQRRAHRKAGGELQAPRHEISNLDTGTVVETKLRGVADQIEQITGMDFDRFTRSMLLAQGGFAAFLQAAADERAPILEQITGTAIYSQISMKIHERRLEERRKLDLLQAELAGLQLLGEDELGHLRAEQMRLNLRENVIGEAITVSSQAISWLDNLAVVEKELAALEALNTDLLGRRQAFEPQRQRLERSLRALELAGDHVLLEAMRRAQKTDREGHLGLLGSRPGLQADIARTRQAVQTADELLARGRAEQNEALPRIRQTRELDVQLIEKVQPIRAATETVTTRQKNLDDLRTKTEEDDRRRGEQQKILQAVELFLSENRVDEELVGQYSAICSSFSALRALAEKQNVRTAERVLLSRKKEQCRRQWQQSVESQEGLQKKYSTVHETYLLRQNDLKALLAGREAADWQKILSDLQERKALLLQLGQSAAALTEAHRLQNECLQTQDKLTVERSALLQEIRAQSTRQAALERELGLLESQLTLLKRIDDMQEARLHLCDNAPCPLCGALDHPYAAGNIPVADATRMALQQVRADLKEAAAALSRLQLRGAGIEKDLEHLTLRQKECAQTISREEKVSSRGKSELDLPFSEQADEAIFSRLQQENTSSLAEVETRVQAVGQCEKELVVLRESLEKDREALIRAERQVQTALSAHEAAGVAVGQAEKDLENLAEELSGLSRDVLQSVAPYGEKDLSVGMLEGVQQRLAARREAWQAAVMKKNEVEKLITGLAVSIQHGVGQITADDEELRSGQVQLAALVAERDLLAARRRELFAEKNPDIEESRLNTSIEAHEKGRLAAERTHTAAQQEMEKLLSRLETIERTMAEREVQLQELFAAFTLRLQQSGFIDESDYQAACLSEDARLSLLQASDQLDREMAETATRRQDKSLQLKTERQKQLTDRPQPQLLQEREEQLQALKMLQQELGAIRTRLSDNEQLREKQQARAEAVEKQNREFRRWDLLHGLIGSADGKKYRNFAQGLTFEIMIGFANRQLRKMSDRYLLLRDEVQPLDLNVVDGYQAGEIRSTRNLSGGESFLVSLALALGLSQMASRNVRVDSLFLDEGFGTLDEEALDTALQTLAGLQQDGKLIGVISHVPALRERIGTRIQVNTQPGGRSVILGPGCRRIEES